jgi:hypothetical protein
LLIISIAIPGVAQEGCLVERGSRDVARIGPVAVSGRLIASVQRGNWETRPGVRVSVMTPSGINDAGRWEAAWIVEDVALDADTAIVAADFGLVSLDLSDPLHPRELDFIDVSGAEHVAVDNGFAYSHSDGAGGNGWFDVVDVSDPSNMDQRGGLYWGRPDPYWLRSGIDAAGGIVVFTCSVGLVVVDVSNPWRPAERGLWKRSGLRDVALVDGLAAVAVTSWTDPEDIGVELVELSNPDEPSPVGFWTAPSSVRSVAEYGGVVVVGTEADGLFLLNIDDPANPLVLEQWPLSDLRVRHLGTAWPTIAFTDRESRAVILGLDAACIPPRAPSGRVGQ